MSFESLRYLPVLLGALLLTSSCKTRNSPSVVESTAPVPPAQYDEYGREIPPTAQGQGGDQSGGRFGYSGTGESGVPAPPPSPRDVSDIAPTAPEPPAPKPSSPSNMVYAIEVPGDPLSVTLPGANASLGKISVEKYDSAGNPTGERHKRGTQVKIPDPNNPGKTIYFKVP